MSSLLDSEGFGAESINSSNALTESGSESSSLSDVENSLRPLLGDRFDGLLDIDNLIERVTARISYVNYLLGDLRVIDTDDSIGIDRFLKFAASAFEAGHTILQSDVPIPSGVPTEVIAGYVERFNRTMTYWSHGIFSIEDVPTGQSTDFLAIPTIAELAQRVMGPLDAPAELAQQIIDSDTAIIENVLQAYTEILAEQQEQVDGVCATIKLRVEQELVMSRSSFLGTFELEPTAHSLENVKLSLVITDSEGNVVANSVFGITNSLLTGIRALDGTDSLDLGEKLKAEFDFLPSLLAAVTGPTRYEIGGVLSFMDEGKQVDIDITPVEINVLPQAELIINYFQERNVIADDPFTEAVESASPFLLGVQVHNVGKGAASDLRIESAQPKILDNQKGLLVDFSILGSEINGVAKSGGGLTVDFGTIGAGEAQNGAWFMEGSVQGKFVEYSASFEHLNALGIPELSLIREVHIHELIHGGDMDGDGKLDFFTNEHADPKDQGDTIFLSNGAQQDVATVEASVASTSVVGKIMTVSLNVEGSSSDWHYLEALTANSSYKVNSVTRADGSVLKSGQYWFTDRTFTNEALRPVYEDKLHIVDDKATSTYTVIFEKVGDVLAPVTIEAGIDAAVVEGTVYTRKIAIVDGEDNGAAGWSYLVNYGDGSSVVSGTTTVPEISLSHKYVDGPNSLVVAVTVTDITGETVTDSFNLTINNQAPTLTLSGAVEVAEDVNYTLNLGDVKDPGTDTVKKYVVHWGDGIDTDTTVGGSVIHSYANPGNYAIKVDLSDEDGSYLAVATKNLKVVPVIKLGDATGRPTLADPNVWAPFWTNPKVGITHKADITDAKESWSAVQLNAVAPTTFAGGDLSNGELGVSGRNAATSTTQQEIQGKEGLRFVLTEAASKVVLNLTQFYVDDDANTSNYNEAGRVQLLNSVGVMLKELVFTADSVAGAKQVSLQSDVAFTSVILTAGSYDNAHNFVFGAYNNDSGTMATAPYTLSGGLHGSDFLVDSVELTLVGVA
jgi:hypothetical protein